MTWTFRAVAVYLKVVRQRKLFQAKGTRGGLFPLSLGGFGGASPEKVLSASMCVFNEFFMRLGPDFSSLGHKDISCRLRN